MTLQFSPFKWSEKSLTTSIIILLVWGQPSKKKKNWNLSLCLEKMIRLLLDTYMNQIPEQSSYILHVIFKWFRRQTKYYLPHFCFYKLVGILFFSTDSKGKFRGVAFHDPHFLNTSSSSKSISFEIFFLSISLSVLSLPSSHNSG